MNCESSANFKQQSFVTWYFGGESFSPFTGYTSLSKNGYVCRLGSFPLSIVEILPSCSIFFYEFLYMLVVIIKLAIFEFIPLFDLSVYILSSYWINIFWMCQRILLLSDYVFWSLHSEIVFFYSFFSNYFKNFLYEQLFKTIASAVMYNNLARHQP